MIIDHLVFFTIGLGLCVIFDCAGVRVVPRTGCACVGMYGICAWLCTHLGLCLIFCRVCLELCLTKVRMCRDAWEISLVKHVLAFL